MAQVPGTLDSSSLEPPPNGSLSNPDSQMLSMEDSLLLLDPPLPDPLPEPPLPEPPPPEPPPPGPPPERLSSSPGESKLLSDESSELPPNELSELSRSSSDELSVPELP